MTEQSTNEGQQVQAQEAVLEPQEGNETPGNLEPENEPESLQNLESKEATVAHDSDLEAALNESAGVGDGEFGEPEGILVAHISDPKPPTFDGGKMAPAIIYGSKPQPPLGGATFPIIGVQPDGSEKFVITVQEGYTDAVRQWAEADGVEVERWLSDRLYEYISTYGEPAKGR